MSDLIPAERLDPAGPATPPVTASEPVVETAAAVPPDRALRGTEPVAPSLAEQLARIEDKTARIEDKFARSEAANQRVLDRFDTAAGRMTEVALQSDLAAVRGEVALIARRVRNLPGLASLVWAAIITAVLTSVLTAILFKYLPGAIR